MSTGVPSDESLVRELASVVLATDRLAKATDYTRRAIIRMGEQIHELLEQLDRDQREALGIGVSIVTRTDGELLESSVGLEIRHLPTIEDAPFERRPGATALYLEAFRGTEDRVLLQIQSTPGKLVSACSSMEHLEPWLEPVLGIVVDDGEARLVTQEMTENRQAVVTRRGADARFIVDAFLAGVAREVQLRARFNRAADLPPR